MHHLDHLCDEQVRPELCDPLYSKPRGLVLTVEASHHQNNDRCEEESHADAVVDKVFNRVFANAVVDKNTMMLHL